MELRKTLEHWFLWHPSLFVHGTWDATLTQRKLQGRSSPLSLCLGQLLMHQPPTSKSKGTGHLEFMLWAIPLGKHECCLGIGSAGAALLFTLQFHPKFSNHFLPDFQFMLQVKSSSSSWKLYLLYFQSHYQMQPLAAANTEKGKTISAKNMRFLVLRAGCLSSKTLSAHESVLPCNGLTILRWKCLFIGRRIHLQRHIYINLMEDRTVRCMRHKWTRKDKTSSS